MKKRSLLSPSEISRLSLSIEASLMELPEFVAADKIALYSSFNSEVRTGLIFKEALLHNKQVYFPRADEERKHLHFIRVLAADELRPGLYDIDEPPHYGEGEEVSVDSLDLVVMPGVAFDRFGSRIGYGKGFYDRVLEGATAFKVALAYGCQVTDQKIPMEAHDVSVDALVTESAIVRF